VRGCQLHGWCLHWLVAEAANCLPLAEWKKHLLQRCNLVLIQGTGLRRLCPPIRRRRQAPTVVRPVDCLLAPKRRRQLHHLHGSHDEATG